MRFFKEYWIYILVILVLLLAIFWSIFRTKQKVTESEENKVVSKMEIKKEDGTTVEVRNIYGQVVGWDYQNKILKVKISKDDIQDFVIDPLVARVMVPMSRQGQTSDQLYIFKKASGPHWETAFCLGDFASLQIDDNNKVEVAVNDGRRMCGYMGAWK